MLGPSGSGKTTCLRLIAGFEQPSAGHIEIFGETAEGVPPYKRNVNTVFQDYALFPHMTVGENVAYGLRIKGVAKAEREARARKALAMVKLAGYEQRRPSQLSGGQRQRVALARALVNGPKALLLDEPLGALDKKLREETQFELVKIQETTGVTFIVVTHDQEEAMSLATRIGVMNQGEIAMIGEPPDIYEYPNSRFVAGFIGSVNMFEGIVVEDEDDHVRIRSAEAGTDIYVSHGVDCAPDQVLWWAIRPEKISLSRERPDGEYAPANVTRGMVEDVVYLGDMSVFQVVLESGKRLRVTKANSLRGDPDANVTHGMVEDVVYLGDMSVFQVALESGKRLRVTKANSLRGDPDAISWNEEVWASWSGAAGSVLTS